MLRVEYSNKTFSILLIESVVGPKSLAQHLFARWFRVRPWRMFLRFRALPIGIDATCSDITQNFREVLAADKDTSLCPFANPKILHLRESRLANLILNLV